MTAALRGCAPRCPPSSILCWNDIAVPLIATLPTEIPIVPSGSAVAATKTTMPVAPRIGRLADHTTQSETSYHMSSSLSPELVELAHLHYELLDKPTDKLLPR